MRVVVVAVVVVVVSPGRKSEERTERKQKERDGGKRPWLVCVRGLSLSTHRNDRAPSTVTWNVSTQGLHQASARDGDVCEETRSSWRREADSRARARGLFGRLLS